MGEAHNRHLQGLPPRVMKPGEPIPVDLKNATKKACACGCEYFIPALNVYTVSVLLSPVGQELTAQLPVLVCLECKKVLDLKGGN
jgi:hypothetical protein